MSKRLKRYKKQNSSNENHFIYETGEAPRIGYIPYTDEIDISSNGRFGLQFNFNYSDNNAYYDNFWMEIDNFRHTYKI